MHAAAINLRGGVSPRDTLLRGQSTIEYVLIAAVIGLVVVFAGPQVSGAIRNQFNQVSNTVGSGTDGDSFMSAEEKAYREAMKTVAQKEAKDWTLDEQKAAATDIAKNGTSSVVYAKAKAAMDANTSWPMKLTDGRTVTYRIIGINHDDLADGSGKAGLTLQFSRDLVNGHIDASGPWAISPLRSNLNSGELFNLFPTEYQQKLAPVIKWTNNDNGMSKTASVSKTEDRVFIPSYRELFGDPVSSLSDYSWLNNEGERYVKACDSGMMRTLDNSWAGIGLTYASQTRLEAAYSSVNNSVRPAFCF